jgi:hypothetical protein
MARRVAYLARDGAELNRVVGERFTRLYAAKDFQEIGRTAFVEITDHLDPDAFTVGSFPFDDPVLSATLRPHIPALTSPDHVLRGEQRRTCLSARGLRRRTREDPGRLVSPAEDQARGIALGGEDAVLLLTGADASGRTPRTRGASWTSKSSTPKPP